MDYDFLILEDDKQRMTKIKQFIIGYTYIHCITSFEAIQVLKNNKIDWVFLDHDLEEDHYIIGSTYDYADFPTNVSGTGQDVADWISISKPNIKGVVIHSLNPAGGKNMERTLLRNNILTKYCPLFWDGRYGNIQHIIN